MCWRLYSLFLLKKLWQGSFHFLLQNEGTGLVRSKTSWKWAENKLCLRVYLLEKTLVFRNEHFQFVFKLKTSLLKIWALIFSILFEYCAQIFIQVVFSLKTSWIWSFLTTIVSENDRFHKEINADQRHGSFWAHFQVVLDCTKPICSFWRRKWKLPSRADKTSTAKSKNVHTFYLCI
jgi:hypothetical protein